MPPVEEQEIKKKKMPLLHCNILMEFKYRKKSIIISKLNPGEKEKDLDRVRQLEKGRLLPKKSLFLSDGYISTTVSSMGKCPKCNSCKASITRGSSRLVVKRSLKKMESWTSSISLHMNRIIFECATYECVRVCATLFLINP